MDKFNTRLFAIPVVIVTAYLSLCMCYTMMNIFNTGVFDICIFDPFKYSDLTEAYVTMSSLIPDNIWEAYINLKDLEVGLFEDYIDTSYVSMIFVLIGYFLVIIGLGGKSSQDCKGGKDDTRRFLITTRPYAFIKAILMPWNIFLDMWKAKYVPVIIPIIFLPFILPFALIGMILIIPIFLIEFCIVKMRIKLAFDADKKDFDANAIRTICPKCKREYYQPKVKCKCGLVMDYPVPSVYGITTHTCAKGHTIPCTNEGGVRGKLTAVCPYCDADIKTHEARPTVISMVGASGSGKTTLMVSAVDTLSDKAKTKALYTEFSSGISPEIRKIKDVLPPTVKGELDSECMFIWSREVHDRELIFNDISGTEFEPTEDRVLFQEYYKYGDGFIFTIDPLAVMALFNSTSNIKSNKITTTGTLESFYNVYTLINGFGPSVQSSVPIAVVLTKMDNARVNSEVTAAGSPEGFLKKYGQEDFVKIIASEFENVKYFATSSLGNNTNAVEPFLWILEKADNELSHLL